MKAKLTLLTKHELDSGLWVGHTVRHLLNDGLDPRQRSKVAQMDNVVQAAAAWHEVHSKLCIYGNRQVCLLWEQLWW